MIYFTQDHEWIRLEGEIAVVGITAHAADALGDIVFFEPRDNNTHVDQGDPAATVESVKAASDIYAPLAGTIVDSNAALSDAPDLINESPLEKGWLFKMRLDDANAVDTLLDQAAYDALIA